MAESAYIKRAKQEEKRHKLATEDGFWFTICFKTQQDKDDFCDFLNIPGGRFISGIDLEKATDPFAPKGETLRALNRQIPACPSFNPVENVERTGYLDEDSYLEAMAIFEAFKEAKPPEKIRVASTSDIWICACFESTDDVMRYQSKMRLGKFGSRHLDGSAWLKELNKHGKNAEGAIPRG